ncbi:intracellular coagulation inhibitor 2-like [Uloborus diversus]|uniref:intracellular coagulation inhibitor 2-like n=1 Tax=Uloborus diversus TaxID=327109 RepID=UPI002409E4DB|nr:intracellular coagulation inhibitor 2-like [Uloborus diversus]
MGGEEDIIESFDTGSFESEIEPFVQAHNDFAVRLFKLLNRESGNVFFSPFSLSTCLAMLYCGADGKTEKEIRDTLGYDTANMNKEDISSSVQQFLTDLEKNQGGCVLELASYLLIHSSCVANEEFKTIVESKFRSSISEVSFDEDSKQINKDVKEWVQNKTHMMTHHTESLNTSDIMVLLNGIYFQGSWLQPFDKQSTVLQCFYNQEDDDNAKEVEMMHLKGTLLCLENDEYQVVQLPFRAEEIAMLVLLPTSKITLDAFEDELTPTFIQDMRRNMHKRKVHLELPKFRLEYCKSVKSCLQSSGLEKIFDKTAEFGGISSSEALVISDILHKTVIDINEEGSEATAATVFTVKCDEADTPVLVDHPFIFAIYDLRSDIILFLGKVGEL